MCRGGCQSAGLHFRFGVIHFSGAYRRLRGDSPSYPKPTQFLDAVRCSSLPRSPCSARHRARRRPVCPSDCGYAARGQPAQNTAARFHAQRGVSASPSSMARRPQMYMKKVSICSIDEARACPSSSPHTTCGMRAFDDQQEQHLKQINHIFGETDSGESSLAAPPSGKPRARYCSGIQFHVRAYCRVRR